jgi:hypothetical protein
VSLSHPTQAEVENKKLMSDVVTFVRITDNAIKLHVSEASRLNEVLQSVAANYYPETFNNEDLLLQAIRYYDSEKALDMGWTGIATTKVGLNNTQPRRRGSLQTLQQDSGGRSQGLPVRFERAHGRPSTYPGHAAVKSDETQVQPAGRNNSNGVVAALTVVPKEGDSLALLRRSDAGRADTVTSSRLKNLMDVGLRGGRVEGPIVLPASLIGLMPPRAAAGRHSGNGKAAFTERKQPLLSSSQGFDPRIRRT